MIWLTSQGFSTILKPLDILLLNMTCLIANSSILFTVYPPFLCSGYIIVDDSTAAINFEIFITFYALSGTKFPTTVTDF